MRTKKPPIGIIPRFIHDENRLKDLRKTIKRYIKSYHKINQEWVSEYNELIEKLINENN